MSVVVSRLSIPSHRLHPAESFSAENSVAVMKIVLDAWSHAFTQKLDSLAFFVVAEKKSTFLCSGKR
jgi:hypothetical protein